MKSGSSRLRYGAVKLSAFLYPLLQNQPLFLQSFNLALIAGDKDGAVRRRNAVEELLHLPFNQKYLVLEFLAALHNVTRFELRQLIQHIIYHPHQRV
ncbi:MAG: hypothetical protein ACK502_03495 [Alphaproteobacteria bacterium]